MSYHERPYDPEHQVQCLERIELKHDATNKIKREAVCEMDQMKNTSAKSDSIEHEDS